MIDKIQFFDRNNGQWTEMLSPLVGFSENFVLDETTDTGNVSFLWRHKEKPEFIKHLAWVRFFHFEDDESQIAKYSNGLPYNHNQYLIGDYSMIQSGVNNYWKVDLQLEEPIIRAKWVQTELLTFTNQTEKTVTYGNGLTQTYTREPYNHYTALERFLKVTPCNCDNYDTGYDWKQNISWFNRLKITEADKEWLKSIPFGSDTWSAADLYVNLMKYLKTTGRVPVFYFDINPETDLPYNMDRDEYQLRFLAQDGSDSEQISLSDLTEHASKVAYSSKLANFATGIVSNVENMSITENGSTVPYGLWLVPEINSNERDLTGYNTVNSGWCLDLKYKIKKIDKIEKLTITTYASYNTSTEIIGETEIKAQSSIEKGLEKYAYEDKDYNALDSRILDETELFHYAEGDTKLYIKNYKGADVGQISERGTTQVYYVEFQMLLDTVINSGDNEYTLAYNTSDSQTDVEKLSAYLTSYIKAMNKCDLVVCKKVKSLNDMVKVGTLVVDGETNYIVSCASYQNINFSYLTAYQLNATNPRRNSSIKVNESIEKNKSIDYQNLKNRYTSFTKNVYLSTSPITATEDGLDKAIFISPFIIKEQPFNLGIFTTTTASGTQNLFIDYSAFYTQDSIGLNFNFIDNGTAGKSKMNSRNSVNNGTALQYATITETTRPDSQIPILYKNQWGEIDNFTLKLVKIDGITSTRDYYYHKEDAPLTFLQAHFYYNTLNNAYKSMLNYPTINIPSTYTIKYQINDIMYLGDMAEKFNFTLYFRYILDKNIILLKSFFSNNCIFGEKEHTYKISFYTKKITKNNISSQDTKYDVSIELNSENNYIEFTSYNYTNDKKACTIWVDNEPSIIINNISGGNTKIYFN